jgi:ABC-2 type transport system permease protein
MGLWAALGMLFAVLFRQSGLAMGLGLVYVIAVEGIILGTLRHYSWMHDLERAFPGANAGALVEAFGSAVPGGIAGAPLVGATQAVLVLIGYLAIFCLLAALLLQRRDVT